jgi:hypothetical protein
MTAVTPRRQGKKSEAAEQFEAPAGLEKVAYCPTSAEPAGPYCQLAQESRVRNAIVVTTDPVTGVPMTTNVVSARDASEASGTPAVYYDLARPNEIMQRCSVHANWNPSDGAPAYRSAESQTMYEPRNYRAGGYQAPRYQTSPYQPPLFHAPSYQARTYQTTTVPAPVPALAPASGAPEYGETVTTDRAPSYGMPIPERTASGVAGVTGVAVAAPSASGTPVSPQQVSSDGRTTTVVSSHGVTRVVVRTPGTTSTAPATFAKPMMPPADAANVIRRP